MADSPSSLVVETCRLTKIYQNRQIALNDVTLTIEPGCVLGLLGPTARARPRSCAWSSACTGRPPAGCASSASR